MVQLDPATILLFRQRLLQWAKAVDRPMPWKGIGDPYRIWLSEVILQQTRVQQGLPYYEKLLARFPDLEALATAPLESLIARWEGLGYYSRARNLHKAARQLWYEQAGRFPQDYAGWLALPGVGPYTAAAISSFANGEVQAVVDGNVIRVLSRLFGIEEAADSPAGKKLFATVAQSLIDPQAPALFNQGMMDFGAILCTPSNPACTKCPFADQCAALQTDRIACLPLKKNRAQKKQRYFHYLVLQGPQGYALHKRTEADIWRDLYEMPNLESDAPLSWTTLQKQFAPPWREWIAGIGSQEIIMVGPLQQTLTHREVIARFFILPQVLPEALPEDYHWYAGAQLADCPLPRLLRRFLDSAQTSLFS